MARHLVLPPCGFGLRLPLIEFRARHELPLHQHRDALEVGLSEIGRRAGARHFRNSIDREWRCGGDGQASLQLCRVGLRFIGLGFRFRRGNTHQHPARRHAASAFDRRRHDTARDLGRDLRLFVRGQRPAGLDMSHQRLLGGLDDSHRNRG